MKTILSAITLTAVSVCSVAAPSQSPAGKSPAADGQEPTPASAQPTVVLQSLQLLNTATIHRLQPLAAHGDGGVRSSGTASIEPFAQVRDASFEPSGRLIALHVEPLDAAPGQTPTRRLLPAKYVRWDEASKRWFTSDGNLLLAELAEVPARAPTADPASNQKSDRPLLASALLQASWGGQAAGAAERTAEAAPAKTAAPAAILWFHPTELSLAFAVVPHGTRFLPLPWPLLRVMDRGATLQLLVDASPARLEDSPTCKDAHEPPNANTRRRCYVHHGLPVPSWDRPATDAAEASANPKQPPTKRGGEESPR